MLSEPTKAGNRAGSRRSTWPRAQAISIALVASSLLAGALDGCVASENAPPARGYVVNSPPPPPIAETRPPPPSSGAQNAVWVAGYWHWVGVQYAWIPGHWEEAPPGARWTAPQYSMRDGAYFYAPGDWQRAPGSPAAPTSPPSPPSQQRPANANAFH